MAKKVKKIAKVAKKAKPAVPKAKKPAKPVAKAAKPAKLVKKVAKKFVEKLMPKKKAVEPVKAAKKPVKDIIKAPVKATAPAKLDEKTKKAMPKTLQAKGSEVEEEVEAVDIKAELAKAIKDVVLTDAEGRILCRVKDCDQPSVVENYCRYHYLFFWKKIQNRKKILSEGKLEQYIEELTSRYPLKFLELIRKDLSSEPDFMSAIQELDIDEASTDVDNFEDENFMEEVRGIGSGDTERVDDEY